MNKAVISILACSAFGLSGAAWAEGGAKLTPGLWEVTTIFSPEYMNKLQETKGLNVQTLGFSGNQMPRKACVSPQEADSMGVGEMGDGNCRIGDKKTVGNTSTVEVVCDKGPKIGTSRLTMEISQDGKSYTFTDDFSGDLFGKRFVDRTRRVGKWLNADCGLVK